MTDIELDGWELSQAIAEADGWTRFVRILGEHCGSPPDLAQASIPIPTYHQDLNPLVALVRRRWPTAAVACEATGVSEERAAYLWLAPTGGRWPKISDGPISIGRGPTDALALARAVLAALRAKASR